VRGGSMLRVRLKWYTPGPADDPAKQGAKGRIKVGFCAHPFEPRAESIEKVDLVLFWAVRNAPFSPETSQ
jgi:hypothetical protein